MPVHCKFLAISLRLWCELKSTCPTKFVWLFPLEILSLPPFLSKNKFWICTVHASRISSAWYHQSNTGLLSTFSKNKIWLTCSCHQNAESKHLCQNLMGRFCSIMGGPSLLQLGQNFLPEKLESAATVGKCSSPPPDASPASLEGNLQNTSARWTVVWENTKRGEVEKSRIASRETKGSSKWALYGTSFSRLLRAFSKLEHLTQTIAISTFSKYHTDQ